MAPSGENCQPWRFVLRDDTCIELWNRPERDQSPYNWEQRGSFMANGAALENMTIAAHAEGFQTNIDILPGPQGHIATISLSPGQMKDALVDFIDKRTTNRKPYQKTPLTEQFKNSLLQASHVVGGVNLSLVEDQQDILKLGRIGSKNEEVMLTNHYMHDFFFEHINWTKAEDDEKKIGFYIDTLELPPPARFMFKILRHWNTCRLLVSLGIHRIVGQENGRTNASAGAIGIITANDTSSYSYVQAGRAFERIWLTATSLGLSVQPLMGMLFLMRKIEAGDDAMFSPEQISQIKSAYTNIFRTINIKGPVLGMFRIGVSEPPTARASRFPLSVALSSE